MAVFNEILVGRFNRALQKLLGIKGPVPAPQIASEFMPVLAFPLDVDFRYLHGWETFAVSINAGAGGAGLFGFAQIENPSASGVVGVLLKVRATAAAAGDTLTMANGPKQAQGGAPVTTNRLDARGRSVGNLLVRVGANAAPNTGYVVIDQLVLDTIRSADFITTRDQEIPLLPGDAAVISTTNANLLFKTSWLWMERPLEDSEIK